MSNSSCEAGLIGPVGHPASDVTGESWRRIFFTLESERDIHTHS